MKLVNREHLTIVHSHLRDRWRKITLWGLGGVCAALVLIQLALPWNNLTMYSAIDTVPVSGISADQATKLLNEKYAELPIEIYFGNSPKPYRQPLPADIGLTIDVKPQVESQLYPWWLRLVPTSFLWAHTVLSVDAPTYSYDDDKVAAYVKKELGESCNVKAQDATLTYKDKKLQVVPAIDGGTCKLIDVEKMLSEVTPRINKNTVRVPMREQPAQIHDEEAKQYGDQLKSKAQSLTIQAGETKVSVPTETFLSWLDFATSDGKITTTVSAERSAEFLTKEVLPKVSVKPGVSKVTTLDFTEISRENGAPGQTLDLPATVTSMTAWVNGSAEVVKAQVKQVAPSAVYTRTYTPTDTGMSALMEQFAKDKGGSWGVSYMALDGSHHNAAYQGDKTFRTASTYKLFVAYGSLKRVEQGKWNFTDQIQGGRNLEKCLDDMIVKSDNPCGETLLSKIGYNTLTNELKAIGLSKSSFMGSFPVTTANDLTRFNGALHAGQLLNGDNTARLIGMMKRNIYRQGIPKGASGQVADKVGFLDAFLHDAAIVYSPKGTYALTIMTEGSSWATMAELTRQIEALRS